MTWSTQHITSSPQFPHGNAHAEEAVHIIKQIYAKANDMKLALLLLKTTPIVNKNVAHEAPANTFFARQLKAHLPILRHHKLPVTCSGNDYASPEVQ